MTGIRVALWLGLLAVAALVVARTPFSTDMSAFLPRAAPAAQQMLVDQLREGVVSRLVLVAIGDVPAEVLAPLSGALAARLRPDPRLSLVANGDPAALERDADLLRRHRYLLSPAVTPGHFSASSLRAALLRDIGLLGSEIGPLVKRTLPFDPTGELVGLVDGLAGRSRPRSVDGVWVSRDGRRALLTVSTRAAGFDIDAQEAALAAIRTGFDSARQAVPGAQQAVLTLSGPPVFAVATRARIRSDAERLSAAATVLVAGVLLLAYRSARLLVLGLLPVASGALAGIAAVGLAFGFVHGITLGFGVTLIGEAVDYAIYLFTQSRPGEAPRDTLRQIWPTLRLGMLTSACGFGAMLLSDFTGFAQLGLFTIAGLAAALAVTRFVLPALLGAGPAAAGSPGLARPVLAAMRLRPQLRWAVLGICALAACAIAAHGVPYWEDELSSMSPIPKAALAEDASLRSELAAPDVRLMLVVTAPDREAALASSEAVARLLETQVAEGRLAGFDAPSRFLPSQATQRARRDALPESAALQADLATALQGLPLRADIFAPFLAEAAAARDAPLLQRADLDGTGLALQVDSLLLRRGAGWAALLPLRGVRDAASLQTLVAGTGAVFLDLRQESDRLLASYRREAVTLAASGLGLITLLLAASLRKARRVAAVLAPLLAAGLCTAALILGTGHRLSIFNLFGLLLTVAVGSNYALFLHRPDGAEPRRVASLVLANLCTVIGFGVLGVSQVPVLYGIGGTVAAGTALSLVFAAVLSPPAPATARP